MGNQIYVDQNELDVSERKIFTNEDFHVQFQKK